MLRFFFFKEEICKENNCKQFNWSTDLEERNKLWQARHNSWFAHKALFPNKKVILTKYSRKFSILVI